MQIGLLGIQMLWTRDAEIALGNARTDKKIMQNTSQKFGELLSMLIDCTTQELTKIERTKFETLITIHVHQKDIFEDMVCMTVTSYYTLKWYIKDVPLEALILTPEFIISKGLTLSYLHGVHVHVCGEL